MLRSIQIMYGREISLLPGFCYKSVHYMSLIARLKFKITITILKF